MKRIARFTVVLALAGGMLVAPATAPAQDTNPLSPLTPSPTPAPTTTATPTVITTAQTQAPGSSTFSGTNAVLIAIGALVLIGAISFFIWYDAHRRAPVRHKAAAATAGGSGKPGSKTKAKPRKLSPAERKRRKRGRAR